MIPADDETPKVVQRIYELYLEGRLGLQAIANLLTDEEVPTPALTYGRKNASIYWHMTSVKLILTNPVYIGDLVAQREHVAALGSTKRKQMPKEEQVIIKNGHPPLISREQFQAVQNLLNRRALRKGSGRPNLFSYLLFCADCGHGMYCVKRNYGNTHYICGTYQKRGAHHCTRHPIGEKYLEEMISRDLKKLMGEYINTGELMEDVRKEVTQEQKRANKEMFALEKQLEKLARRKISAEDKWLDAEWDKQRYHEVLERLDREMFEARQRLSKLQREQESTKINLPDIAKLATFDRLDRQLVLLLIKQIDVHGNGKVDITYNFTV